jgi:aryl-alcohol dehydrogenase-like predicted oxidoreductase
MKFRNIGRSGLRVSVIGLGCNAFGGRIDFDASRAVVEKALDLGITLFDTADIYGDRGGSETALGKILKGKRDGIVLASKFGGPMDDAGFAKGASRRYIIQAVEASLRRLQTDRIDLYQLHFPDPATPMEETLRALDDLVHQGKVRYIGNSNLSAWQVADAHHLARQLNTNAYISCQNEFSMLVRDAQEELLPAAHAFGLGVLPYFPLAGGLLTGKYARNAAAPQGTRFHTQRQLGERYSTDANFEIVERLKSYADSKGHALVELSINWLLSQPCISSVIAGATKPSQVEQNVSSSDWELTAQEAEEVDTLIAGP